jgi:hypothetical protein
MVTRRVALKQLAVISAGTVFITSCSSGSKPSLRFKNISVAGDQEAMLGAIADTLIPKTSAPGAVELKVPEFMTKMIDDCQTKQDQQKWLAGMNKFSAEVEKRDGKSFTELSAEERLKFLTDFEASKIEDEELNFFYKTTRGLAIRGYTSSEYFMTTVQNYNILPGSFKGCVAVNNPS